jgi:hypothetical protein
MKWNSPLVGVAVGLLVLASPAFAQDDDELEVTLQVLDDVEDIDGVVLSVGDEESAEAESEEREAAEDASDGPALGREDDDEADEDFESERDEDSEGRVEDREIEELPAEGDAIDELDDNTGDVAAEETV